MADDRTHAATPFRNPIATGEYVPEATPVNDSTEHTGPGPRPPADDLPDVPGYDVSRELARGGMGRVLAATDLAFRREVAVKVLLPKYRAEDGARTRFVREAHVTARLAHPGIPPAHHLGTLADGSPFLAMKLVRGHTLAALLKGRPSPAHNLGWFVGVVEQVCQAVGFAHAGGVVHRDLKPGNVMVGAFGEVQVMDWGIARVRAEGAGPTPEESRTRAWCDPAEAVTHAGVVMGTPAYMAPEQARGEDADARADVFALGGILCEVLTGARPFRGTADEALARAKAGDVAEARADLDACAADPELVDVARLCLSPTRGPRPADGQRVADLLAAYRAGVDARLRAAEQDRAAAEARVAEGRKRRRVQLVLAAALVLLVAGGGAVGVWRVSEDGKKRLDARLREEEQERRTAAADEQVNTLFERVLAELGAGDADRAAALLDQAERRAKDAGLTSPADRVRRYRAEVTSQRALDAVDDVRWTLVDGRPASPTAVTDGWRAALKGYGIAPGTTPPAEAAARVNGSAIRTSLLVALDGWLARAPGAEVDHVRAVLDAADPGRFRAEVRQLVAARDAAGLAVRATRPEWADLPTGLAQAVAQVVPPDAARGVLVSAVARRPNDFNLLMGVAATYPPDTEVGAAERVGWYQAAATLRPKAFAVRVALGTALRDLGDGDRAFETIREAVRLNPRSAIGHNNLGILLRDRGDAAAAEAALGEAIRLDPGYAPAHGNLGNVYFDRGDMPRAVAAYREAVRLDPTRVTTLNNLGSALRVSGEPAEAEALFNRAIELQPDYATPRNGLAGVLLGRGDADGAVAQLREAVRLNPRNDVFHCNLGDTLHKAGRPAEALAPIQQAVKINPRSVDAYSNLALVYSALNDPARAAAAARKALQIDPRAAVALNAYGVALHQTGDAAGAVAQFEKALAVERGSVRVRHNLGAALRDRGDFDGALAVFRDIFRENPADADALSNIGTVFEARGDLDGAGREYRAAVAVDPGNPYAHANLGDVYRKQGRVGEAVAAYRAALAIDPNHGLARDGLGYCVRLQAGRVPTAPPPRAATR